MTPKERELEDRIRKLENRIYRLSSIPQVSITSTLSDIILVVNKITDSLKRKR